MTRSIRLASALHALRGWPAFDLPVTSLQLDKAMSFDITYQTICY